MKYCLKNDFNRDRPDLIMSNKNLQCSYRLLKCRKLTIGFPKLNKVHGVCKSEVLPSEQRYEPRKYSSHTKHRARYSTTRSLALYWLTLTGYNKNVIIMHFFSIVPYVQYFFILIRCPAQPNIKDLSCNRQPLIYRFSQA